MPRGQRAARASVIQQHRLITPQNVGGGGGADENLDY
jgi:hypothetical protein